MPEPLDGLEKLQLEAVTHSGGPLLVLGGPGTGKTHVLVRRLAWLVGNGVPGDRVVAVAHPSAAALMRADVEAIVPAEDEGPCVCTVSELCSGLLHEDAVETALPPFFATASSADRVALLLERIDELALRHHEIRGNPVPLLAGLVARIDGLKERMISAGDCRRDAESLTAGARDEPARARAARAQEFARIYEDHDRMLAASGALDRGELVLRTARLLEEKARDGERLAERFAHVLVDDHHTKSPAEARVLELLGTGPSELTVASDDLAGGGPNEIELPDFATRPEGRPEGRVVRLTRSHRSGRRILAAAAAVAGGEEHVKPPRRRSPGTVRFWRCCSEQAQARAVAAEVERLLGGGCPPAAVGVIVPSTEEEGAAVGAALEERAIQYRLTGAAGYFKRAEVRDLLAWLRLLGDADDSGAIVRALSRPPIELHSVDIARLTQLARRRRLDMVSAAAAARDGPQLSPEGRDRVGDFLRLYRSASAAFEEMRPDAFVHRLVQRIGLRRQQLLSARGDALERLRAVAVLADIAAGHLRCWPEATTRDFVRYVTAVAETGLSVDGQDPGGVMLDGVAAGAAASTVAIVPIWATRGLELEHAFVVGLSREASTRERHNGRAGSGDGDERCLLHTAMTRARESVVLTWAESGERARPSPLYEAARAHLDGTEEVMEDELFSPAAGLHSTFRAMREELLDTVSQVAGQLRDMRLDTHVDVSRAVARYLELIKLAALIDRSSEGQPVSEALPEVNDLLAQGASPEQREAFLGSTLDTYLRGEEEDGHVRAEAPSDGIGTRPESSLEPFIPRRGKGLMLSSSDIELYRRCPLKYKFARVFRIPQEPTINQRFGIVVHQVLERFHADGDGSLEHLMQLLDAAWRRAGFGSSNDEVQFRARAVTALRRYWELDSGRQSQPVAFERSFSFRLRDHIVRGRVDRVDRRPDGRYELIDYKTGQPQTPDELRHDLQLSLYQMGARESWGLETSAQSYYYVLDNEKVPVAHSADELERVRATVEEIASGILALRFPPKPSPELCAFCDYRIVCPASER